jgi:4-diphosphocytidyl-2C-methyl-D-erythritol kinase
VEGIGERVRELDDLEMPPILALTPEIAVSTARVFSQFNLTNNAPDSTIETFLRTADPSCLVNQLMPVTYRLYPEIRTAEGTCVRRDARRC